MKINKIYNISKDRATKTIFTNLCLGINIKDRKAIEETDSEYFLYNRVLEICRRRNITDDTRNYALRRVYGQLGFNEEQINERLFSKDQAEIETDVNEDGETVVINIPDDTKALWIKELINFFSEFGFTPSYRFINTFCRHNKKKNYVYGYFKISNHPYAEEIAQKIKSAEFTEICSHFDQIRDAQPEMKAINNRFELFYGEPGTGKTTEALKLAKKCIVCQSDMLPADLMQNFCFKDGKADFDPSDLWKAMENGETIVLDEVNMLTFEALRFLQGITDGKEAIDYKGHHIEIKDGFKIIGTMNLNVNGNVIPLCDPLVDRCVDIKEFKLNEKDLLAALM